MEPSDSPLLEPIEPQYDGVIRKLQALERESGERLARTRE